MKKTWKRPELQILKRTKKDEYVLEKCKNYGAEGPDMPWEGGCGIWDPPKCDAILTS